MARIVRIWIDEDTCLTDGFCVEACPEVFEFDDASGSALPRIRPEAELLFVSKEKEIRAAEAVCPYGAIHIEEREDALRDN